MTEKSEKKARVSWSSMKKLFKLYSFIKPYRTKFIIGLIFLVLSSLANLAFPKYMGQLIDTSSESIMIENINETALILLGLLVAQAVFGFFRVILFVNVTENTLKSLRQTTYEHLIKLPFSYFNKHRVGELNSRISSDITVLQDALTTTLAELIRQIIIIFGGIAAMVILTSWKLTLFMLAVVPPIIIGAIIFGRFIRKYSKAAQKQVAESNTIVEETLQGIYNVKAFANEMFEVVRYNKKTEEVAKFGIKGGLYRGAFSSFIVVGIFGAIVAVVWRGSSLVLAGEIQASDLFSFILYSIFIGASIGGLADVFARIQKAVGATEEVLEILDEDKEDLKTVNSRMPNFKGEITASNVAFAYPSRPDIQVLKGINFSVNSGEQVALVGPSGAGKSTIVQLVMRFFDPTSGAFTFDGKDASTYNLSELRNEMAVVPQDVFLFGGTIRENIEYGKPGATEEEIMEAAKQANAWKFVSEFPEGLDTIVGERGVQLSGGQRQRIAIARAVLKNPKILILDEATSALDSESERLVQEALDKLMEGRTSIVIAHRLSTVRSADNILVIDGGQIVESGTHDQLSANEDGLYYQLASMQFNA